VSYALNKRDKDERRRYALLAWRLLQTPVLKESMADIVMPSVKALGKAGYGTAAGKDMEAVCKDIWLRFGSTKLVDYQ
jgi:hypothetical protein